MLLTAILIAMNQVNLGDMLMPRQLPPVDDDVFDALQRLAEPLIDDVNSVLRRLLGMDETMPSTSSNESRPHPPSVQQAPSRRSPAATASEGGAYRPRKGESGIGQTASCSRYSPPRARV